MRKVFYLVIFSAILFISKSTSAQSSYINHTLKQGETLSALAKEYKANVGDIMRINGMHANTKLVYGSVIKIPSSKKIIAATETIKLAATQLTPANALTHKVIKGETLYSISKQYGVSVEQIKTWNNLIENSAKLGSILIVGNNNNDTAGSKPLTDIKRERVETIQPAVTAAVIQQKTGTANTVVENATSDNITQGNTLNTGTQSAPVNNVAFKTDTTTVANTAFDISKKPEGYFADAFKKGRKQQHTSGISKTFKTASGWNDGKYYLLADDITPGTIVKLTAENGNAVYAKVLWSLGNLKENSGINFRISNAAAAALKENTDAFNLDIYY